ncbi:MULTISPECIES: nucleotidyltransferase family protein [unclassified Lysobacter]|uniref:nucleotidyltransferase family protein n=1 Tax=unclassified Lysobacter TaxID=2635362 RepID=UPI001BE74041|nr:MULTISPECIES: nucleotidyltransferase family protein [unclassified Lysobacter]MBT2747364.1 nucleotidyltransferase family protein [Lysobacter sp. ISL-42]MBT2750877.1 nucleotidyltransferase family protein [Lysobacter sp. ISL-50]MBT2778338.1 nucleotidyltransferase family protein [Lysobacter sp. ISL-54]MBT2783998.1 nucleotidyltransferase family protein [Lysobacter sp. ISL-52]
MKALIFAAGLGERMRPLSLHTPKPLLAVGGKRLIEWHLEKLAGIGVREVVINTSWLAEQFPVALGDGARWGLRLRFSYEGETPLETGGGMLHALELLHEGTDPRTPFIVANGDIWTDYDFAALPREFDGDAHLLLVDNPVQRPLGDFQLENGRIGNEGESRLTYSGIGLYRASLFDDWRAVLRAAVGDTADAHRTPPRFSTVPLLRASAARGRIGGEHHRGRWTDVGTPERLQQLDAALTAEQHA